MVSDSSISIFPSGQDEFFRQYYGYVRRIVAQTPGIPTQDSEDVAMEIMTRLVERDVLSMFDPGMKFSHDGREIQANFRTFLVAQVKMYVKGHRDRIGRQYRHETAVLDAPVASSDQGSSMPMADLFSGGGEDDFSHLDAAEWVRQARTFLGTVPRRSDRDGCDLVRLFDDLVEQALLTGSVQVGETAVRMGVSPAVTSRWIAWLRQNLRQQSVLSRRLIIGGEPYTAYHVQQAVSLLKSVRGAPHVKQPLARAGNPLWRMDYHKISRFERSTYPECEVPSLHKGKGYYAPHVLNAVVHHLERVSSA